MNKDTELYRFERELDHYLAAIHKVVPKTEPLTVDTEIGSFADEALDEEEPAR